MNPLTKINRLAEIIGDTLGDDAVTSHNVNRGAVYVSAQVNGYRLHLMESAHPWGAANELYDLIVEDMAPNGGVRSRSLAPLLSENDVTLMLFGLRLHVRD